MFSTPDRPAKRRMPVHSPPSKSVTSPPKPISPPTPQRIVDNPMWGEKPPERPLMTTSVKVTYAPSRLTLCCVVVCGLLVLHQWWLYPLHVIIEFPAQEFYPRQLSEAFSDEEKAESRPQKPDGYFNGFPLVRVDEKPVTDTHCIGDNFNFSSSWIFRSCHYETYCYDLEKEEYVVLRESPPVKHKSSDWFLGSFSSTNPTLVETSVFAGSQSKSWMPGNSDRNYNISRKIGMFRPKLQIGKAPSMYYMMPGVTIVNYFRHNKSFKNPGHLIWDDFMGMFTLLDIFDRVDDTIMLSELKREIRPHVYFTRKFENDLIRKFLPLMGSHTYNTQTYRGFEVSELDWPEDIDQRLICASHGLVGSGMFADHRFDHWHGQVWYDYVIPHNTGRGGLFRRFREYMMNNLKINPDTQLTRPYQMIVSQNSTTKEDRRGLMFEEHMEALTFRYGSKRILYRPVILHTLSLREQIEITSQSAFFLSVVGGSAVTAFFLPKDASLLLYNVMGHKLDWDLWNNFPHIKTHWLPRVERMLYDKEMTCFVDLVGDELNRLDRLGLRSQISG